VVVQDVQSPAAEPLGDVPTTWTASQYVLAVCHDTQMGDVAAPAMKAPGAASASLVLVVTLVIADASGGHRDAGQVKRHAVGALRPVAVEPDDAVSVLIDLPGPRMAGVRTARAIHLGFESFSQRN